jgi:hypothetical protein
MIEGIEEKLNYYNQFEGSHKNRIKNEIQRPLALYNSAVKIAYGFDDPNYAEKLAKQFQAILKESDLK